MSVSSTAWHAALFLTWRSGRMGLRPIPSTHWPWWLAEGNRNLYRVEATYIGVTSDHFVTVGNRRFTGFGHALKR